MKYRYIFALCAASILAFSCQKEQSVPQETVLPESGNEAVTILTAGIEQTKTVLDGTSVLWKDGNKINVNGEESTALSLAVPSASAEFTLGVISLPYKALYPASAYTSASTLTLPYTQEYTSGSFADGAAAMYAYTTEGNNLSFHHLTCIVKVSVTRASSDPDTHDIKYVEFRSNGAEKVSGLFSIDYTTGELTPSGAAGDTDNAVRVTGSVSTASGADFYIAVPANTYASGFTVKVCDTEGHYMEKSKGASTALEAGHIHPMAAFEFVPTHTEVGTIIITSAEELTTFATNWNSGAYSDADPFTVQLGNDITFTSEEAAAFPGIGTNSTRFTVSFDGKDHTITMAGNTSGLFGYIGDGGTVENLQIAGTSTVNSNGYFGTLVNVNYGTVSNITFCGSISSTYDGAETVFVVGGICGLNEGSLKNCNSNDDASVSVHSALTSKYIRIGGICGFQGHSNTSAKMDYCTNRASISSNLKGGTDDSDFIGGVIGDLENGSLYKCYNYGAVTDGSRKVDQYVGGIAGRIGLSETTPSVTYCKNSGLISNRKYSEGTFGKTGESAQKNYIGGIAGMNYSNALDSLSNVGQITISVIRSTTTSTRTCAGGIVGMTEGAIDGSGDGSEQRIRNSGTVIFNRAAGNIVTSNAWRAVAGVVGRTHASLSGLYNEGDVQFSPEGSGAISGGSTVDNGCISLGGIFGTQRTNAITINGCTNVGNVQFNGANYTSSINIYLGGVFGHANENTTIVNCSNTGSVDGTLSQDGDGVKTVTKGSIYGYASNVL